MLTVLVATLAVTHPAMVGVWVLALLVLLLAVATDVGVPMLVAICIPAGAVALSVWRLSNSCRGSKTVSKASGRPERVLHVFRLYFSKDIFRTWLSDAAKRIQRTCVSHMEYRDV